jgi:hypothetical protein
MREVGLVLKANPNVPLLEPDGIVLRTEVRDTALLEGQPTADRSAVEEAYTLLNHRLGTVGLDDLYDIAYGKSGVNYPKAAARARNDLARADRSKMSPGLAITVDLHAAGSNNCGAIKALLDRAGEKGDERTLNLLRPLTAPKYQGHWKKVDLLGCIHDGSLARAISDIETRVRSGKR